VVLFRRVREMEQGVSSSFCLDRETSCCHSLEEERQGLHCQQVDRLRLDSLQAARVERQLCEAQLQWVDYLASAKHRVERLCLDPDEQ